jgi:drug/metabolite transporter (DMT)-like permease
MAILLAVAAAFGWGASDYFGGYASRPGRPVFALVAATAALGVLLMLAVLAARGVPPPDNPRLLLAAVAGVAVTAELSLIYRALSLGDSFITAPVGALGAATAVTIGLISGDPLDLAIAGGLLLALLGGGISAWISPTTTRARGSSSALHSAAICLGAAVALGTMLTCLHAAGRLDPYWATATEHLSTALSAGVVALIVDRRSPRRRLSLPKLPMLVLIAVVGAGGDLAYTTASHQGTLSIVSAISSLYSITTIALGRLLQGQGATRIQLLGVTAALFGAALLGAAAS